MADGDVFNTPALLHASNPWWRAATPDPGANVRAHRWQARLLAWVTAADAPAVLVLEGARQTGKSTLLAGLAMDLVAQGIPAGRVCRWCLDDTPLRWSDPASLLDAWQALQPGRADADYLLIDDVHLWSGDHLQTLGQLQREHGLRLVVSALPTALAPVGNRLAQPDQQIARLRLSSLNFADVLAGQGCLPELPAAPRSLRETFDWPRSQFAAMASALRSLGAQFHEYLLRGSSLPANAGDSVAQAHRALRRDVIERAIRVDGPGLHNVRRVDDLMRTLDYLAARNGTLLDVPDLCAQLTVERPTVRHFLQLLEDLQLIHRIPPLGYGDTVQRARFRICAADPGLPHALLWQETFQGATESALAASVESALHRHLLGAYGSRGVQVSFAPLGRQGSTLVVGSGKTLLPFAQQYGSSKTTPRDLVNLISFCREHAIQRAYVATRLPEDCGPLLIGAGDLAVMRLPAPLLCLWLAAAESPRLEYGAAAPAVTRAALPAQ